MYLRRSKNMSKKEPQWLIDRAFNMDAANSEKVINTMKILNGIRLKKYDYEKAIAMIVENKYCPSKERYERSTQTLYKSYGLILEKDIISKTGIELAEGRISFKEMLLMQLFKKQYRNDEGVMVRPLVVTLKVLLKIKEINESEAWLDSYDYFNFLTEIFDYESIDLMIGKILDARKNNVSRIIDDSKDADIWANAFISAGLFTKYDSHSYAYTLNENTLELAKFIAENHEKSPLITSNWLEEFSDPYRGIVQLLPIIANENSFKISNFSFDVVKKVINNRIVYGLNQRENDQNVFFTNGVYSDSNRGFISQAILKAAGVSKVEAGIFSFLKNYENILLFYPKKLYDIIENGNSLMNIENYWLCSANSSIYNHDESFKKFGEIDWAQDKHFKKATVGDIVFIYSSSPTKQVKYKCIIMQKDITKDNKLDDKEFWTNPSQEEDYNGLYIKFKLLKEVDDERLKYENLLIHGLIAAPQGAYKLDDEKFELAKYIDSIFEGCYDLEQENEFQNKKNQHLYEIFGDGRNLIVYGTPGCGKSYYVDNTLVKNDKCEKIIRTTFYQDYTNTDFIGQILPYVKPNGDVTYMFNPGPFALALKEALLLGEGHNVALIIEELNRGNAPAIFGDVFQLLDRSNGISRYGITNVNLLDWLNKELSSNLNTIKIPGNLFIYATMNTSDQNVFTLDTAFKRRWEFLKLKNTFDDYIDALGNKHTHEYKKYKVPGMKGITWQQFVDEINKAIVGKNGERESGINVSDKQLGVYFIDKDGLYKEIANVNEETEKHVAEKFAYKIFSYLWDDVAKFDKDQLFAKGIITLDELIDKFVEHKLIFEETLQNTFSFLETKKDSESSETE